jgi:hypothetical protein
MKLKSKYVVDVVLVLSLASALTMACSSPPPPVVPDGGDAGTRPATCATACENLRARGCPLGASTPRGATCEQVCENVKVNNGGLGFPARCITAATTCAKADACR